MTTDIAPLLDYGLVRRHESATIFVHRTDTTYLVLGSRQPASVLREEARRASTLRRRRGGGGIVELHPDGIWVDWWIPASDPRWTPDIRHAADRVGAWWRTALERHGAGSVSVHAGPVSGAAEHLVICFAGRGPGEVFVSGRKAVGLMQWRVREGALLSTQIPARPATRIVPMLAAPPPGIASELHHHTVGTLGLRDTSSLVETLANLGGPWAREFVDHPAG